MILVDLRRPAFLVGRPVFLVITAVGYRTKDWRCLQLFPGARSTPFTDQARAGRRAPPTRNCRVHPPIQKAGTQRPLNFSTPDPGGPAGPLRLARHPTGPRRRLLG